MGWPILDISIGCNEIGVVKEVKYASLTMPFYVIKGDNYVRKKQIGIKKRCKINYGFDFEEEFQHWIYVTGAGWGI